MTAPDASRPDPSVDGPGLDTPDVMPGPRFCFLGPQEMRRLDLACLPIWRAFHQLPYLVGSVNTRRDYRDVDVRLILPDDHPIHYMGNTSALNFALSEYLRLTTGLPVDFQIQTQTEAHEHSGERNPLGVRWTA